MNSTTSSLLLNLECRLVTACLTTPGLQVSYVPTVSDWALENCELDEKYHKCWEGLESRFDGTFEGKEFPEQLLKDDLPAVQQEEGPA